MSSSRASVRNWLIRHPLQAIARKSGFNADMLAYSILEPHPRMNMTVTREEADDIAAYIATLGK